ncbi:MAG: DNA methyltransferase [Ilumatobacteraceae bacterium]
MQTLDEGDSAASCRSEHWMSNRSVTSTKACSTTPPPEPTAGCSACPALGGREPEIELDHLESLDEAVLLDFLKEQTGRAKEATASRLERGADVGEADRLFGTRWGAAFSADEATADKARRFAAFVRSNSSGEPTVFQPGSVYVSDSAHRSATGTHYTPRSLTQEIVEHTLSRLVFDGPDHTGDKNQWQLRPSAEILGLAICDPACGSGAFLVQACRYLAAHLVEARLIEGAISEPTEDEYVRARREVAERCLHGVDINPMACEMAKLSLWLTTLAKDKPFSFLDHAIKCGDALLGITDLRQLTRYDLRTSDRHAAAQLLDAADEIDLVIEQARRAHAAVVDVESDTAEAIWAKSLALQQANAAMATIEAIANDLATTTLARAGSKGLSSALETGVLWWRAG